MTNEETIALPSGYQLENYRLETVLGHGGFGITYRAKDGDLRKTVAIKEYLPREVAFRGQDSTVVPLSQGDRETFEWGLERFLDEARTLARFGHPNIVGVHRFLRTNGTAYLVMDYCEGESLESMLGREGTLAPDRLEAMLVPLLNALEVLHAAGVTHRDIKPGNIYLREDGSPVLLDFGAARQALAQHSRSVTAMATPGYAAFEQYSTKGKQGPWTDIYGLGATLYRCVTGQRPPDASDRMLEDELVPTVEMASGSYPKPLLQKIDAALQLRPEDRPPSVECWGRQEIPRSDLEAKRSDADDKNVLEAKSKTPEGPRKRYHPKRRVLAWVWLPGAAAVVGLLVWGGTGEPDRGPQPSRENPFLDLVPRGTGEPDRGPQPSRENPFLDLVPRGTGEPDRGLQPRADADEHPLPPWERAWTVLPPLDASADKYPEPAPPVDPATLAQEAEIDRLLNVLEEDLAADRLTIPPSRNALERVEAILELSPGHEQALEGRGRIIARYEELVGAALARGQLDRAESLLRRMDEVQAGTSVASDLRDRISRAREAEQREQARLAAALIAGRYRVHGDTGEIVQDTTTGLQWQRCSLGQTWDEDACNGDGRRFTWGGAREAADRVVGWRMPTIDELRTLTYCSGGQPARFNGGLGCRGEFDRPTIVREAFPNTPDWFFWSGSPHAGHSDRAWHVSFANGSDGWSGKGANGRVRLVRDGQ